MDVDPAELRYLEDDDTPAMKTIKGATTGFVTGTIFGTIVATWYDVPRVERSVALPGLIRTLKMMGNYGVTFAAIGGVYIGVEQLVQNYRGKRDFVNGAVGGFVAGASILGYKGKYICCCVLFCYSGM
jgi:import inner membrane translocase subunit TIM22